MIDAMFHTAKDAFASAEGDKPTQWIVFRVTDVKTPALDAEFARRQEDRPNIARARLGDDLFGQYVAWLEDDLGTSINQSVLAQALGNSAPDTN